jgi:hypothetical protein
MVTLGHQSPVAQKDLAAALDYGFDWGASKYGKAAWLVADETIVSLVVTATTDITSAVVGTGGSKTVAWFAGGTVSGTYAIYFIITRSEDRNDSHSMQIQVVGR